MLTIFLVVYDSEPNFLVHFMGVNFISVSVCSSVSILCGVCCWTFSHNKMCILRVHCRVVVDVDVSPQENKNIILYYVDVLLRRNACMHVVKELIMY
jgi:hypothetical protein